MLIIVWTFRLRQGVSDDGFIAANDRVQMEFVYHQPGLVRRTTARGEDGEWLVITIWGSEEEAAAADSLAQTDEVVRRANEMIDPASASVTRFHTLD